MSRKIKTYKEFWPFYLREHANPRNRALHYLATIALFVLCGLSYVQADARLLILIPFVSYGLAWIGHFGIEHNTPATFKYPGWSLISDFRMFFVWLTGGMKKALEEAGAVVTDKK